MYAHTHTHARPGLTRRLIRETIAQMTHPLIESGLLAILPFSAIMRAVDSAIAENYGLDIFNATDRATKADLKRLELYFFIQYLTQQPQGKVFVYDDTADSNHLALRLERFRGLVHIITYPMGYECLKTQISKPSDLSTEIELAYQSTRRTKKKFVKKLAELEIKLKDNTKVGLFQKIG